MYRRSGVKAVPVTAIDEYGHNGSGNIHVHIVVNSVRAVDVERRDFMERSCDNQAGNKHHLTNDYLKHLKQQVMTMCQNRQLYQVDLLNPALDKVTEQEYWAARRGQEKLDERNAEITASGLKPRNTKFETQKQTLRKAISEIATQSKSFEEFQNCYLILMAFLFTTSEVHMQLLQQLHYILLFICTYSAQCPE